MLMGTISPLQGIGPDDLKIKGLLSRIAGGATEVILATSPTVNATLGTATSNTTITDNEFASLSIARSESSHFSGTRRRLKWRTRSRFFQM